MEIISGRAGNAFYDSALALERGRAGREAEAMRLDITSRSGAGEDDAQDFVDGDANEEARRRAARRHAVNPNKSFERHYGDAIAADPQLAARVRAERNAAQKRLLAGA